MPGPDDTAADVAEIVRLQRAVDSRQAAAWEARVASMKAKAAAQTAKAALLEAKLARDCYLADLAAGRPLFAATPATEPERTLETKVAAAMYAGGDETDDDAGDQPEEDGRDRCLVCGVAAGQACLPHSDDDADDDAEMAADLAEHFERVDAAIAHIKAFSAKPKRPRRKPKPAAPDPTPGEDGVFLVYRNDRKTPLEAVRAASLSAAAAWAKARHPRDRTRVRPDDGRAARLAVYEARTTEGVVM